jgi:hypothetical protein
MRDTESLSLLRLHSFGGVRLSDIIDLLSAVDHAYNGLLIFNNLFRERTEQTTRQVIYERPWVPFRAGRYGLKLSPEEIALLVLPTDRLILHSAQLQSPGLLDFLGKLNPLEVIRQFMVDRHERRKDLEYREDAERRRLDLENYILEMDAVKATIENARSIGATDEDLAPILNQVLYTPLKTLQQFQDRGLLETAEIIERNPDPMRPRRHISPLDDE